MIHTRDEKVEAAIELFQAKSWWRMCDLTLNVKTLCRYSHATSRRSFFLVDLPFAIVC